MSGNRLASQTSPYLRQHGHDPVDWYPWGEEALGEALRTSRPVFLSIGYASCHWCHVMHRESFADPAVAEMLNRSFVSIKVDRESRPDIDELYMAYVVASTGHGGWPMSVFLTPELVPIFGGTYFPPSAGLGMPSFPSVLDRVATAFAEHSGELASTAHEAMQHLGSMFAPLPPAELGMHVAERAGRVLLASADPRNGGFGAAPKFPQAPVTDFLLAYHDASADGRALNVAEAAVEGMIRGGIYDQAGGGISRYSVDGEWLVPHFEKMLYDNAQLLSTLAALHHAAPCDEWAHVARQTFAFLERDLLLPSGAYASSLDADTEGHEGATYVWSFEELQRLLGADELNLAGRELGVAPNGNWEGTSILTRRGGRGVEPDAVDSVLAQLLRARSHRAQPARDDKAIVCWNALTARGLIAAGVAFSDSRMLDRGLALIRLLVEEAVADDDGVMRLLCDPESGNVRVLEDAAALAIAALEAADEDSGLRAEAARIMARARSLFYDGNGTWYMTSPDTELPARPREQHDGATPSGASLAALAAVRLASHRAGWLEVAEATLARVVPLAERSPFAAGTGLIALLELLRQRQGGA